MKNVSRDIKNRRMRDLENLNEVNVMIEGGAKPSVIASYIQNELKLWRDLRPRSAEQAVRRYIKTHPPAKLLTKDPEVAILLEPADGLPKPPKYISQLREKLTDGLDALKELSALIALQLERINSQHELEESNKSPMANLRREVEAANKMLVDYVKLEMELGIREKEPDRVDIRSVQRAQLDVGENLLKYLTGLGLDVPALLDGDIVDAESVRLLTEPKDMKRALREGLIKEKDNGHIPS